MTDPYELQRTLRTIREVAQQRGVLAVLDIGTSKIGCLVLRLDQVYKADNTDLAVPFSRRQGFRVIGAATTRSRGVRYGEIQNMSETERAVRTAVQAAQKMAKTRVDQVVVSFSGGTPKSYGLAGEVEVLDQVVSEADLSNVVFACDHPQLGHAREILHAQPVNFVLDNTSGLTDPTGQAGNVLATDVHLLSVDEDILHNIFHCIDRCDLQIAGVTTSSYMSALSSLVEDEQELGAACIDFGGGSTSISVFVKKHMIYSDVVRLGGDHITGDISMGLQIPMTLAERIKTFYGGAIATGIDDREMIDIGGDSGDWEHDRRQVSRAELIGIIRPRIEEILEEVHARLGAAGFDHLPSRQVVLTGGASQLPGLDGMASRFLGHNVRLGRPMRVQGLPQAATGPAFSTAVGLALHAAGGQQECWDFEAPPEDLSSQPLKRALQWFKENW